ncbi:MAG TPA: recombinase family protein, partial [Azospirillum sp.]|nr:recombinase family protein [Azospirillum sp.]
NATGKLVFTVIAAMAEFERNLIVERTRAGLAAARDRGRRGGRPPKLNDRQLAMAEAALADPSNTGTEVAAQFGVHRVTLLRQLKAYRERRAAKK